MHAQERFIGFLHALQLHRSPAAGRHQPPDRADGQTLHRLFQVSTLNAVMEGVYDGEVSVGELRGQGDFGLGTFDALDGELMAVDGTFHQLRADGSARLADDAMTTPFAVVLFFEQQWQEPITRPLELSEIPDRLRAWAGSENYFFAIRVDGRFSRIVCRSVPRQSKPYPPLVEVTRHQSVFEFSDVAGTMVGFRFPDFAEGINMPGFHFHFLAEGGEAGGHVLDFTISDGSVSADHTSEFFLELPETPAFGDADLGKDERAAIHEAEGLGD